MSDGETSAEPAPSPTVPPASRLGAILGWGLPALGVACLIASLWVGISAESAWHTAQSLPVNTVAEGAAYDAAYAAYHEETLRAYLLVIAGFVALSIVPGLLYAARPSLLGGPNGRLLRWTSANVASRYSQRRHPISFYQGLGFALPGVGLTVFFLGTIGATLTPLASAGGWPFFLIVLAGLLNLAAMFMRIPLAAGSWWFKS